jgi:hypothetical protein
MLDAEKLGGMDGGPFRGRPPQRAKHTTDRSQKAASICIASVNPDLAMSS